VQAFIPPAFLFATEVLDWRDRGGGGDGGTGGIDPKRQLPRGGARRCHAGGGEEIEDDEHVGVASPLAAALQCPAPLVYYIVFPHFPIFGLILFLDMFSALALLVADDPYRTYRVGSEALGRVTVDMYLHSPHPCTLEKSMKKKK
jgi:hypothetical protein